MYSVGTDPVRTGLGWPVRVYTVQASTPVRWVPSHTGVRDADRVPSTLRRSHNDNASVLSVAEGCVRVSDPPEKTCSTRWLFEWIRCMDEGWRGWSEHFIPLFFRFRERLDQKKTRRRTSASQTGPFSVN